MILGTIIIASLISAYLFNALPVYKIAILILNLQKESFKVIKDNGLTDEQKQRMLLAYSGRILLSTTKEVFLIVFSILPFFCSEIIWYLILARNDFLKILVSVEGICITSLTYILFYIIKKFYGRFRI
jgi:hypothetical protein